jgi:hypothetical protein
MALIQIQLHRWPTAESRKPPSYRDSKTQTLDLAPSEAFAFVKTAVALPTISKRPTVPATGGRQR